MNEEKIEKMLRETVVLMSWCHLANFFLQARYSSTYGQIYDLVLRFIRSYGTKEDKEVLRKIPQLVEADIAEREGRKKKSVSVDMEADEARKRWVAGLLKDIARQLEK